MCFDFVHIITVIYLFQNTRKNIRLEYSRNSIVQIDNNQQNNEAPNNASRVWFIYFSYTVINLIVVGGVNIAYIVTVLHQSSDIIEFKLFWNSLISPLMVHFFSYNL